MNKDEWAAKYQPLRYLIAERSRINTAISRINPYLDQLRREALLNQVRSAGKKIESHRSGSVYLEPSRVEFPHELFVDGVRHRIECRHPCEICIDQEQHDDLYSNEDDDDEFGPEFQFDTREDYYAYYAMMASDVKERTKRKRFGSEAEAKSESK